MNFRLRELTPAARGDQDAESTCSIRNIHLSLLPPNFRPFWYPGTIPDSFFALWQREDVPVPGERGQLPNPEHMRQQADPAAATSATEYNSHHHKFKLETSSFFRRPSAWLQYKQDGRSPGLLRKRRGPPPLATVHFP